jgi:plasmid stability protein
MAVMITLPDELEARLKRRAKGLRLSLENLVLEILGRAVGADEYFPTPEEVVAKIQVTPPNPHGIRLAEASLAEALRNAPQDPDFDLATWNREWEEAEAEMKATTRINAIAEGRG